MIFSNLQGILCCIYHACLIVLDKVFLSEILLVVVYIFFLQKSGGYTLINRILYRGVIFTDLSELQYPKYRQI